MMLLVCGGQHRTLNQDHKEQPITIYPPVLAVLGEDEAWKLDHILPTIINPFVVRLSDKDLVKIVNSEAGRKILGE